ncbi:hypothetical protein GCM10009555_027190 [Acrocarpospora macrocephala]|uniref:Uncharacterized protein n=1 Tax=Acrocarpospora macrocephala TaxID=150177 RepID=A0A5M3WPH2_9ACTN|nr:hypothetical protein [Acrocarpospora macrocephala]GES10834.1 hypothetical protein Amac_044310 [Acrocarpospora macrocephala]
MSAAERRRAELRAKLGGLEAELASWSELSRAGGPLEKHHTQVAAIVAAMAVPIAELRPRVDAADVLDTWPETERSLLRIHQVLEYFRSKLTLRFVAAFRDYLAMADEFAWECYRLARQRGSGPHNVPADRVREPPLTFFSQDSTPFAIPRGASYRSEIGVLPPGTLRAVVERLPVPVIGIPWFQLRHLPDALVLAHEVGHHVETDFRLTPTLERLVDAAVPAARRPVWRRWLGEVFADVYGTLAAGPAFAAALTDFLATGPDSGQGAYPPSRIRIALAAEVLGEPSSDKADPDVPAIAAALVAGPYPEFGGIALSDVINFNQERQVAERTATQLLRGFAIKGAPSVRTLLAAAGLAFGSDPLAYEQGNVADAVVKAALATIKQGIRGADTPTDPVRDTKAGQAIMDILTAPPDNPS